MPLHNVIIIGSGPAGYTAALYAGRANLKPLMIAGETIQERSLIPGGQLMLTSDVENFPGFPEGILGPELMERFKKQALRFGTEFVEQHVIKVDFSKRPFEVYTKEAKFEGRSIILSTGSSAKWLGLPNEQRLRLSGGGVSACATCDGFFYKGKEVAVVGGGDTAMEEGNFLTKYATKVTIIHRRDQFRASKIMLDRAKKNPKVALLTDTTVEDVLGQERITGLKLKNVKTGKVSEFPAGGLFLAIGHDPNTEIVKGQITLDDKGYIVTDKRCRTNIEGVWAAGDVQDHVYRQAITAAGTGCAAAIEAERWLEAQGH